MHKAHRADVRGAGLWPTGVHETPRNAVHQVPLFTKTRALVRKASRGDARGAGLWPTGVLWVLRNAAHQVPHPAKTRVLVRKAPGGDVYWSTLASRERGGRGSASSQKCAVGESVGVVGNSSRACAVGHNDDSLVGTVLLQCLKDACLGEGVKVAGGLVE